MDFKQIENSIKISESKSISAASEGLFITQSALNQQLIHLENELGVKLFQRSKSGVYLTEAGTAYIKYAHELLALKKEMMNVLSDYSNYKTGTIKIGLPVIHGGEMFTHIFPLFHEKYPHVHLVPIELSYSQRFHMINSGELDLAFVTLAESDQTDDEYFPILNEEIYLAAPADNPLTPALEACEEVDLSLLKEAQFVLINQGTSLRKYTDILFRKAGFYPNIILETSSYHTITTIVSFGKTFSITPQIIENEKGNIKYLHIKDRPFRTFCALHKKNAYMSQPLKEFLELSINYWKNK